MKTLFIVTVFLLLVSGPLSAFDSQVSGELSDRIPTGVRAIRIEGSHFRGAKVVRIDGIPTSFNIESDALIKAVVPPGKKGTVAVLVETMTGSIESRIDLPEVLPEGTGASSIEGFRPLTGPAMGGDMLEILGQNFKPDQSYKVFLGGVAGQDVHVIAEDRISLKTPLHAAGKVQVVVVSPDGSHKTLPVNYEYKKGPVIESIQPAVVPTVGGSALIVRGQGFSDKAKLKVRVGGVDATIDSVDNGRSIQMRAPVHEEGIFDVTVINEDQQTANLPGALTYQAAPAIKGITLE